MCIGHWCRSRRSWGWRGCQFGSLLPWLCANHCLSARQTFPDHMEVRRHQGFVCFLSSISDTNHQPNFLSTPPTSQFSCMNQARQHEWIHVQLSFSILIFLDSFNVRLPGNLANQMAQKEWGSQFRSKQEVCAGYVWRCCCFWPQRNKKDTTGTQTGPTAVSGLDRIYICENSAPLTWWGAICIWSQFSENLILIEHYRILTKNIKHPPPHKSLRMQDASFHITPPLNRIFAMISADGLSLLFPLLLFQMSGFNVTVHILCYNMKMVRKEHTWILHFPSTCGSW